MLHYRFTFKLTLSVAISFIFLQCNPHDLNTENLNFSNYLIKQKGSIPVIITAPHGGWAQPNQAHDANPISARQACKISERKPNPLVPHNCRGGRCAIGGEGPPKSAGYDQWSWLLAILFSKELETCFSGKPYFVVTTIARAYIDFNRDANDPNGNYHCAFDDPNARTYWEDYHNQIEQYIEEAYSKYGKQVMLLDFHSHDKKGYETTAIVGLGEAWGQTVPNLRLKDKNLPFFYDSQTGLMNQLEELGQDLNLKVYPTTIEDNYKMLGGGYTVKRYSRLYPEYGGPQANPTQPMVDALQLEIGPSLRAHPNLVNRLEPDLDTLEYTATVMAQAFCNTWLVHQKSWQK